jgi:hypothetical protein
MELRPSPPESAIDQAFVACLDDSRPPLPIGETFLADALHFAWAHPPDLPRAVLLAAIACEVKVKQILRERTTSSIRPMIDVLLENHEIGPWRQQRCLIRPWRQRWVDL